MSEMLSKIERDFVVQYFYDEKPDFIIKNVETRYIPGEEELPVFQPLKIKKNAYIVNDETLIFPRSKNSRVLADNAQVVVFFYYKGRALSFESVYHHINNGFAIKIDSSIQQYVEKTESFAQDISLMIYADEIKFNLTTNKNFELFKKNDTQDVLKTFYNADLTDDFAAIDSRVYPPLLLALTDEYLLAGVNGTFISFAAHQIYQIEIVIPQAIIERKIYAAAICTDFYTDKDNVDRICYRFDFMNLKNEDKRFLYEKTYNIPYD